MNNAWYSYTRTCNRPHSLLRRNILYTIIINGNPYGLSCYLRLDEAPSTVPYLKLLTVYYSTKASRSVLSSPDLALAVSIEIGRRSKSAARNYGTYGPAGADQTASPAGVSTCRRSSSAGPAGAWSEGLGT